MCERYSHIFWLGYAFLLGGWTAGLAIVKYLLNSLMCLSVFFPKA